MEPTKTTPIDPIEDDTLPGANEDCDREDDDECEEGDE